jgi:NarL family two-component system sensor histidine kinase LiaS
MPTAESQTRHPHEFRIGRLTAEPCDLVHELHDTVIQPLSSLLISMTRLECQPLSRDQFESALSTWKELAQEALDALRSSLAGLQSPTLASDDLPLALRRMLLPQFTVHGLELKLESQSWPIDLPPEWNANLYLTVREALTNVLKHARTTQVSVLLFADSAELGVTIKDNGVGFASVDGLSERDVQPGCGLGITTMRERIARLGGQMVVSSAQGRGVQIDIRLPQPKPLDSWTAAVAGMR